MATGLIDYLHPFVYNFLIGLDLTDLAKKFLLSLSEKNKRMVNNKWKIAKLLDVVSHEEVIKIMQNNGFSNENECATAISVNDFTDHDNSCKRDGNSFTDENILPANDSSSSKDGSYFQDLSMFICTICKRKYKTVKSLKRHIKCKHPMINSKQNALVLTKHVSQIPTDDPPSSFSSMHNTTVKLTCTPSKPSETKMELASNENQDCPKKDKKLSVKKRKLYKCAKCEVSYSKKKKLITHIKTHFKGKKNQNYECWTCGKHFITKDIVVQHIMLHDEINKIIKSKKHLHSGGSRRKRSTFEKV